MKERRTTQSQCGGVLYNINAKGKRRRVTVNDGTEKDVKVGETVTAGEYRWERINEITEDQREEPHFETTFKCNMFYSEANVREGQRR